MAVTPTSNPDVWLQNYLKRNKEISESGNQSFPTPSPSHTIANNILRSNIPADKQSGSQGFMDGSHWWDEKTSAGSRILDVMSRFNYGAAGAYKSLYHQGEEGKNNPLEEYAKGFTGKTKETFGKVIADEAPQFADEHPYVSAFAGFGADVLTDPTTYLGPGEVKAGVNAGLKAANKIIPKIPAEIPKFGRAKNALIDATTEAHTPPTDLSHLFTERKSPDGVQEQLPFEVAPSTPNATGKNPFPEGSHFSSNIVPDKGTPLVDRSNRIFPPVGTPIETSVPEHFGKNLSNIEMFNALGLKPPKNGIMSPEDIQRAINHAYDDPAARYGNTDTTGRAFPKTGMVPTKDLENYKAYGSNFDEGNPRKYSWSKQDEETIASIRDDIRSGYGLETPIRFQFAPGEGGPKESWKQGYGLIEDGHHRLEAARREGLTNVPVQVIHGPRNFSEVTIKPLKDIKPDFGTPSSWHPDTFFPNTQKAIPKKFRDVTQTQDMLPLEEFGANTSKLLASGEKPLAAESKRSFVADMAVSELKSREKTLMSGVNTDRKLAQHLPIDPLHKYVPSNLSAKEVALTKLMSSVETDTPNAIKTTTEHKSRLASAILKTHSASEIKKGFTIVGRSGERLDPKYVGEEIDRYVTTGHGLGKQGIKLPIENLIKIVSMDKIPDLGGYSFKRGRKVIQLNTLVKQVKKAYDESLRMVPLRGEEQAAWKAKYKDVFTKDEMRKIIASTNMKNSAGGTKTLINKIMAENTHLPKNYETITELQKAMDSGDIPLAERNRLARLRRDFGLKKLADIEKKITAATKLAFRAKEVAEKKILTPSGVKVLEPITKKPYIWDNKELFDSTQRYVDDILGKGEIPKAFEKPKVTLSEDEAKIIAGAVDHAGGEQFIKSQLTRNGTRSNQKAFNAMAQINMGKYIISRASKILRGIPLEKRPAAMYDSVMRMLLAGEQRFRQLGVPIRLGTGVDGLQLSVHDALSALDRKFVEQYFFGPKAMGMSQLTKITELHALKTLNPGMDIKQKILDILVEPMSNSGAFSPLSKLIRQAGPNEQFIVKAARDAEKEINSAFSKASPKITDAISRNAAEDAVRVGEETAQLTDEAVKRITIELSEGTPQTIIESALKVDALIDKTIKTTKPVSAQARALAKEQVLAAQAKILPMETIRATAKAAKEFALAKNDLNMAAKTGTKLSATRAEEVRQILGEEAYRKLSLSQDAEFAFGVNQYRAVAPSLGNEVLRRIFTARISVGKTNAHRFATVLRTLDKDFTKEELVNGMKALQEGREIPEGINAHRALYESLREMVGMIKDPAGNIYGMISRNGLNAEQLIPKFKKVGLGDKFKLNFDNLDDSWRNWNIEDPLDTMSKFHTVLANAVAERELGAEISRLHGSKTISSTHNIKITDPYNKSILHKLIDTDLYFTEEAARQMHMMDTTLKELNATDKSGGLLRLYDAVLHSYKAGLTIYRPGHHFRNLMGDMWLSSMDGVVHPKYYNRSRHVLATRPEMYKDFDALRTLQTPYVGIGKAPFDPKKTITTLKYKGQNVHLTAEQLYRMGYDHGILPDYNVLDDIIKSDKATELAMKYSFFKGNIHKGVTLASEYRDHWVRMAHFIKVLEENGGKIAGDTLENAVKDAARVSGDRVRKWHPDGSDLSHMEQKYARRVIMFYSWTRKIIPLVIETGLTRPGRFMMVPKANTNLAIANNINNREGHSDAFPSDQLFPSYLTDSVQGPIWGQPGKYVGMIPGWPHLDTIDDYGNSPRKTFQSFAGSLAPPEKQFIELGMNQNIRTGGRITDLSDYWDNQIPGGNYLAALTGKSPTSGFRDSVDTASSNQEYQGNPNLPGNSPQITKFVNWLTGQGIMDFSKPSYIKRAQIEQGGK